MTDLISADWKQQDSDNVNPAPNGVQGGYSPLQVAPIIRAIRGALKRFHDQTNPVFTTTGSGAAFVLTYIQGPTAYSKGLIYRFWAHADNTGAATLNINALGPKAILSPLGAPLIAGMIKANKVVEVVYNGTSFELLSAVTHDASFTGNTNISGASSFSGAANFANTVSFASTTAFNGATTFGGAVDISNTGPTFRMMETDTNTHGRLTLTGNILYLQAGAAGQGANTSSGALRFSGLNSADISEFTVRHSGAWRTIWHSGNDGSGSGLDAGLLEGQDGSYYRDLANSTGTLPSARLSGTYSGSLTFSNAPSFTATTDGNTALSFTTERPWHVRQRGIGSGATLSFENTSSKGIGMSNEGTWTGHQIFFQPSPSGAFISINGNNVWHAGNDGSGSGLDAGLLEGQNAAFFRNASNLNAGTLPNARISGAYDGITNLGITGALTIQNGAPVIRMIDTTAGQYSARMRVDSNNVYFDSSSDDVTFGEVFRFELDTKIGYVNGSRIWTDSYATTAKINGIIGYTPANSGNSITAGNGLSGGGTMAATRTISLGTPGSLNGSTTNAVTSTSHTHAISLTPSDVGAVPLGRSVNAGNGLTGGGTLDNAVTITLGNPLEITSTSANQVNSSTHSHAINTADVYADGSSSRQFNNIGTYALASRGSNLSPNTTTAGSNLTVVSLDGNSNSATMGGTWRAMSNIATAGLFLRIS